MELDIKYYKWISFVLGILTVIFIWLIFYASSIYDFANTKDSYDDFFCNGVGQNNNST